MAWHRIASHRTAAHVAPAFARGAAPSAPQVASALETEFVAVLVKAIAIPLIKY